MDVAHENRPGRGAVGGPQLAAMGAIPGEEEDPVAELPEDHGQGAAGSRADVAHQGGSGGRAVGLPELDAMDAVVRGEEERAVECREKATEEGGERERLLARIEVRHLKRRLGHGRRGEEEGEGPGGEDSWLHGELLRAAAVGPVPPR